ncbi:hypothetical protein birk_70 [Salmonella phage birk]|uniref:Phage neck terminator protein gp12-like domain-containing protein n=1 Tax=Salmonella phage birk TaxID=2713282 RepID=A0A6G8RBU0_9CAUD|nr:hypothetical protein HWD20_gp70 [Salmonella phage birk]QIN98644.1 hypothetical protein birk_70 [Salmonella phage birk]
MATTTLQQFSIKDLRELVQKLLTLPDGSCIIGEESGTVDGTPYVYLRPGDAYDFGPPRTRQGSDGFEYVSKPMMTAVRITAVGKNAAELMRKLHIALGSSPAKQFNRLRHYAITKISKIDNVGGAIGAGYAQKSMMTVDISYVHKVKIEQPYIYKVDITCMDDNGNKATGTVEEQ